MAISEDLIDRLAETTKKTTEEFDRLIPATLDRLVNMSNEAVAEGVVAMLGDYQRFSHEMNIDTSVSDNMDAESLFKVLSRAGILKEKDDGTADVHIAVAMRMRMLLQLKSP